MIRISVGTEHIDDILHDFQQAFEASSAADPKAEGDESNAEKTGAGNIDEGQAHMGGAT